MAKSKRKIVEIDPDLLRRYEEFKSKRAEDRIKVAEVLARTEEALRWLRIVASGR